MFVSEQARLGVPIAAAQARLPDLLSGDQLMKISADAYGEGLTGLMRVGPSSGPMSRLVRAQFRPPVTHGDALVLALRWEASGPGGRLFPALDADITLTPAGDMHTELKLVGAYRPPFGVLGELLDRALLHRVAGATIRSFVARVAAVLADPAQSGAGEQGARNWEFRATPCAQD